jgi:cell division protein FtsB
MCCNWCTCLQVLAFELVKKGWDDDAAKLAKEDAAQREKVAVAERFDVIEREMKAAKEEREAQRRSIEKLTAEKEENEAKIRKLEDGRRIEPKKKGWFY